MSSSELYIGLMSGTSADAVDAVLLDLSQGCKLLNHHTTKIAPPLRQRIHQLSLPGDDEIEQLGVLDVELGELFASAVLQLLDKAQISTQQITAIGSHGQTIRHRPPGQRPRAFSLQIGDPNVIAQATGITTVADFRRRDMAVGGQGAPLVPAFHRAIFGSSQQHRAIVNIGGMANISWLPIAGQLLGFDTGPGNVLMDSWIQTHHQASYDKDGAWAATGTINPPLLKQLLSHPKSTGRESFNSTWLNAQLAQLNAPISNEDVQASLLELTAQSIAQAINALSGEQKEVYVCGGGAYNGVLMARLEQLACNASLSSTASLGVAPEWIEAMAFAWLAQQTLARKPGNLAAVTGATQEVILGGIYLA
jgi:anhydro-N-acetylmuramic acid kinase